MVTIPIRLFQYPGSEQDTVRFEQTVAIASKIWEPDITLPVKGDLKELETDDAVEKALGNLKSAVKNKRALSVVLSERTLERSVQDAKRGLFKALNNMLEPYDDVQAFLACGYPLLAANGISKPPLQRLFIANSTTVTDGRVLAHELGHVLLDVGNEYHDKCDSDQLMANETEGTHLTPEERAKAVKRAKELGFS